MTLRRTYQATSRCLFSDVCTSLERVWTLRVLPANSHQPALTVKSARQLARNPKTDIVVAVIARIVVATGRTAIPRIIDPGAAAQLLYCPPQSIVYAGNE